MRQNNGFGTKGATGAANDKIVNLCKLAGTVDMG